MKKVIIFVLILAGLGIGAGFFLLRSRPEPEQVLRANVTEAQKMLVTLRRAQTVYRQETGASAFQYIAARRNSGKMVYSEKWKAMKLPEADLKTGFDYECAPVEGSCRALEAGKEGPTGNGIRIDIASGIFTCLGMYQPVTTQGFDGRSVVVACQA